MIPWDALITGAVGVAGIGGTILVTRMNIQAERQRTIGADKRLIYARCLAGLDDLAVALENPKLYKNQPATDRERAAAEDGLGASRLAAMHALDALLLIASREVGQLARQTLDGLWGNGAYGAPGLPKYDESREQLLGTMRADLGGPVKT